MEKGVPGRNIDYSSNSKPLPQNHWATPLPLFQSLQNFKPNNNILERRPTTFYLKAPPPKCQRKFDLSTSTPTISPNFSTNTTIMPTHRRLPSVSEQMNSGIDVGTLTNRIEVEHEETQTDDGGIIIGNYKDAATITPIFSTINTHDRSTSPIPNQMGDDGDNERRMGSSNKKLYKELENITGHIIIQKFITRTEEELQEFIKIKFPGLKVVGCGKEEEETNHPHNTLSSLSSYLNTEIDSEHNTKTRNEKSDEIIESVTVEESPQLQEFSLLNIKKEKEEKSTNDSIKEVNSSVKTIQSLQCDMVSFEESLDLLTEKEEVIPITPRIKELRFHESESIRIKPCETTTQEESSRNSENIPSSSLIQSLSFEIQTEGVIDDATFIDNSKTDQITEEEKEEKVEIKNIILSCDDNVDDEEIVVDVGDVGVCDEIIDDDDGSTCSSIIQSVNYFGEKDDDGTEDSDEECLIINDEVSFVNKVEEPEAISSTRGCGRSIATQTEANITTSSTGGYLNETRQRRRRPGHHTTSHLSSAGNSSTTTTGSQTIVDLSLRLEKVDLKLRLGRNKTRKKMNKTDPSSFSKFHLRRDHHHLNFLEVRGERIKMKDEVVEEGGPTSSKL